MPAIKFSDQQILESLTELNKTLPKINQWEISEGKLYKKFQFHSFVKAFEWMNRVAVVAESLNHHPEWFNVYNIVKVYLTTHDVKGISDFDFLLAKEMEMLAQ